MSQKFIGKTFGNLKVLRRSKQPCAKNNTLWDCKCMHCGTILPYYQGNIKRHKGNCVCDRQRDKHILNNIILITKTSAQKRNIKFNLSKKQLLQLLEKQNYQCALSGLSIAIGKRWENKEVTASIDRIDSNGIYEILNVQWVHKDINKLKNIFSQSDFIKYCKLVAAKN